MASGLRGGPVAHVALVALVAPRVALLNSISENSYETRQFREIRVYHREKRLDLRF